MVAHETGHRDDNGGVPWLRMKQVDYSEFKNCCTLPRVNQTEVLQNSLCVTLSTQWPMPSIGTDERTDRLQVDNPVTLATNRNRTPESSDFERRCARKAKARDEHTRFWRFISRSTQKGDTGRHTPPPWLNSYSPLSVGILFQAPSTKEVYTLNAAPPISCSLQSTTRVCCILPLQ